MQLVLMYAGQILNPNSTIKAESKEVVEDAWIYVKDIEGMGAKRVANLCEVALGLSTGQLLLGQTLPHLPSYFWTLCCTSRRGACGWCCGLLSGEHIWIRTMRRLCWLWNVTYIVCCGSIVVQAEICWDAGVRSATFQVFRDNRVLLQKRSVLWPARTAEGTEDMQREYYGGERRIGTRVGGECVRVGGTRQQVRKKCMDWACTILHHTVCKPCNIPARWQDVSASAATIATTEQYGAWAYTIAWECQCAHGF